MNVKKMLRTMLIFAGTAALLLAPAAARAQQEIDPTAFDVQPLEAQSAVVQTVQAVGPTAAAEIATTADLKAAPQITTLDTFLLLALLSCAAWIVLREIAAVTWRRSMPSAP